MPKPSQADRVKRWSERVIAADKIYEAWEKEYDCGTLQNYYRGKQWKGLPETEAQKRYVINLIFPTIETQIPALMFYRPQVKVEPRPPHADDANSDAAGRAELAENTLQTFIDDPKVHFKAHTLLALRDAYFRFALVEVGYSADWLDNPNAGKPLLRDDGSEMPDTEQPKQVPRKNTEQLFVKRIDPRSFRVSLSGKNILEENDWVAYSEWHYVEDVKANKKYRNTANLEATGTVRDLPNVSNDPDRQRHVGMIKLWKIWDLRQKVKHVIADGFDKFLLEDEAFKFLPIAALKFYDVPDEWYPLPVVYNWIGPQDELNETREMQKTHRRRFTRRYTFAAGSIDEPEIEKLETGGDGVYAKANTPPGVSPLTAVPDAPLDKSNTVEEVAQSREDFATISGVTGEANATPQADTATQANIMNVRQQIRESQARVLVSEWLASIARIMLLTIREQMQLPFWVQVNTDPYAQDAQAQQRTAEEWKEVSSEDLGDMDFDVKVDIASLSPVSEDVQRANWNQVLMLLTNPALLMLLMTPNQQSPNEPTPLLRKTLAFYGIKSDQEVREIMRVGVATLQQMAMQAAAMAAQKAGVGGMMPGLGGGAGGGQPALPGQQPAGQPSAGPMVQ